ncbi:MAG TPA: protein phosphatase 2C domain-containing protein [Gemmataceae bacterium]|nr:protein phosphatase 2C domain-containing protein [Gemmataceae bacterium]
MRGESDVDTDVFTLPSPADDRSYRSISALIQVELGALSDAGKVRPNNEDHFLVARFDRNMQALLTNLPADHIPEQRGETAYSMLVADGMGGEAAGEVASRNAIRVLVDLVLQTPDWILRLDDGWLQRVRQRMEQRFQQVQEALTEQAREDPALSGMGTTMTLACSVGADLLLVHAGDSRAYLFRHDRLHRLNCDHTMAQSLADAGAIPPQEVATHPWRHMLTNVLGGRDKPVRVEFHELRLLDGDQILLCTDGLTDLLPDDAIRKVLRSADTAADACRSLVDRALDAGGKDNVTVVLGRYRIPEERE